MKTRTTRRQREGRAVPAARLPMNGSSKSKRVDLGLALLSRVAIPGVCYTYEEIAHWCGCTNSSIYSIERAALGKLRAGLESNGDPALRELAEDLFARQSATHHLTLENPKLPRRSEPQ